MTDQSPDSGCRESETVRDRAIEAMAAPMRELLGGDWVRYKGGEGLAVLALRGLLPIIEETLRDQAEVKYVGGSWDHAADLIDHEFGGELR